MNWFLRGIVVFIALCGIGLTYAGGDRLWLRDTGTVATASVDSCHTTGGRYGGTSCEGTWVLGGSLLGNGHVIVGDIIGASQSDQGKTLKVKIHGGTAYTGGVALAFVLIGLGVLLMVGSVGFARAARSPRRRRPAPARLADPSDSAGPADPAGVVT